MYYICDGSPDHNLEYEVDHGWRELQKTSEMREVFRAVLTDQATACPAFYTRLCDGGGCYNILIYFCGGCYNILIYFCGG